MKKFLSLLIVALFATAMISCEKEKEDAFANNTLVYDGVVFHGTSAATGFVNGEPGFIQYVLDNYSDTASLMLTGGLYENDHNCTLNLAENNPDHHFNFTISAQKGDTGVDLQFWGYEGTLDGEGTNGTGLFTSGTATITVTDDQHLTIDVEGTLTNGKKLKFNIDTDYQMVK